MDQQTPLPLVPIIVGVVGKRDLAGADEFARHRINELLADLELRLPYSPLVMVTGLAEGADLVATRVALARERWTVVGVLPFRRELFLEDFEPGSAWRQEIEEIVERSPSRFLLKILKPLKDATGLPFADEALKRIQPTGNPIRRMHYEQAGLFIAHVSGLLIALMSKMEEPDKVGGTARIVEYKRQGKLDAQSSAIIDASEEVASCEILDCEAKGLVHLIDLNTVRDHRERIITNTAPWQAWSTLERIDAFNRTVLESRSDGTDMTPTSATTLLSGSDTDAASSYLRRIRLRLSQVQGQAKNELTRSMWVLAALFVSAVAVLELFSKLWPNTPWLFASYLVLLAAGLGVFARTTRRRLQPVAEDFRAAAEALRVQIEWWRLGLLGPLHRVDRFYLVGGEGHFAVLRRGIKAVVDAAYLLRPSDSAWPEPELFQIEDEDGWIPNQIKFFKRVGEQRHRSAIRMSSIAWCLFQMSVGVAVAVGAMKLFYWLGWYGTVRTVISFGGTWLPVVTIAFAVIWACILVLWIRIPEPTDFPAPSGVLDRLRHRLTYSQVLGVQGHHSGKRGWVISIAFAALLVTSIVGVALQWGIQPSAAFEKMEKIAIVLIVVLAAASGAARFVLERRGIEAEAISYREALQRFSIARDHTAAARKSADLTLNGSTNVLRGEQALGFALGLAALNENESWLRAHRQRPIEPIV